MLTTPQHGWTDFQLEGTSVYALSHLTDIPFEWLDRAIYGLEALDSFTVTGHLEPGLMTCTVHYDHCRIGDRESPTSMLTFCRALHDDLNRDLDAWAGFCTHKATSRKDDLIQKLDRLGRLITVKAAQFPENW